MRRFKHALWQLSVLLALPFVILGYLAEDFSDWVFFWSQR